MKNIINNLIFKLTGRRYCYRIKVVYKSKNGNNVFDYWQTTLLVDKCDILNNRLVKKISLPLHKLKMVPKFLLKNGVIVFEDITYLGWLKDVKK